MVDVPNPAPRANARPALGSLAMLWRFARRYPGRIAGALAALIPGYADLARQACGRYSV